jgi:hypothetical protein
MLLCFASMYVGQQRGTRLLYLFREVGAHYNQDASLFATTLFHRLISYHLFIIMLGRV